jgi:hypothetical protein
MQTANQQHLRLLREIKAKYQPPITKGETIMITKSHGRMTIEEWIRVQDCPIQRDTERHAAKAKNKHLKSPSLTHLNVSAATVGGEMFKLDGHTRAFLWKTGSLDRLSEWLDVTIYDCTTIQEVNDLYRQFDNSNASETPADKLSGAYRLHGIAQESLLIRNGPVMTAIVLILGENSSKIDIYQAIGQFVDDLKLIDSYGFPKTQKVPIPILAAMIATVHADGASAMEFWRAYINNEGFKDDKGSDGVQALTELVLTLRGRENYKRATIAGKAISAYKARKTGYRYKQGLKATDFSAYIKDEAKIIRGVSASRLGN